MQPQPFPYIVPVCEASIDILHEDADILVINKPDLLLSQPGKHPENKDSVITRLSPDYPEMRLIHRLDLDTSGLMIIPLHKEAAAHLARQFQDRKIQKQYTAVLFGHLEADQGTIEFPIAKDWQNPPLQKICEESGRRAITHYEVLERLKDINATRVLLKPVTGRTHQLRIHTRTINHPILGCDLYATDEAFFMAKRLMLHASELTFTHPGNEEPVNFKCPAPF